jgi:hypothetical protein
MILNIINIIFSPFAEFLLSFSLLLLPVFLITGIYACININAILTKIKEDLKNVNNYVYALHDKCCEMRSYLRNIDNSICEFKKEDKNENQ